QEQTHDLSRSQKSARQAVSAHLPEFDGNPEDWSHFEACFEETTKLCGYSDGENVARLRQALKGKALKAVQSRLRRGEHLSEIMETLRNTFGHEGSSITLTEDELCHELQLKGAKKPLCLSWTGGQQREENESMEVSLNVSAIGNNKRSYRMQLVRTVKKLDLPEQSINCNQLAAKYKHLKSLPLSSFNPSAPKLIIAMDHYFFTRPLKTIERSMEEPVATKTRLG
uniref:Uncharacterized protein n=1 Tax=Anopheles arabiensis TaxID=7173 RepID=A0A182IEP3_ANOAR